MHKAPLPALILALALVTASASAQQASAAPQAIDPKWMTVDSAAKKVTFELIAGHTTVNGGLNFDGFKDGELTFVVPAGWAVTVNFVNRDAALPHSIQVIPEAQSMPLRAVQPALAGATTKDADLGTVAGGGKDRFQFSASPAGNYILFCAVAGHGMGGMWLRLKVDGAAAAPLIVRTP